MPGVAGDGSSSPRRSRAQLVLAAAAVVAVALAPVVLAYLQLGYHGDVRAAAEYDDPGANAQRFLGRAVHEASAGVPARYAWAERRAAVAAVRARLDDRRETLAASRVAEGTTYRTGYNQTAAAAWAREHCPGGPDRRFGPCEVRDGIVLQERAGRTHVLAVGLDVTVVTARSEGSWTVVVRSVGD